MSRPRASNAQPLGLLAVVGSLAVLTTGAALYLVVLYAALKDRCRSTPSPRGALLSEAPDTLRVTPNGWPLGTTCNWALAAGGRHSVASGSIPLSLLVYGLILAGIAGTVVFSVVLRRNWAAQGWPSVGAVVCLVVASGALPFALLFSSPAFVTAGQLFSGSPTSLCMRWFGSEGDDHEGPVFVRIEGVVEPPLAITCGYFNSASQLHEHTVSGWTWPLATTTVVLLGVSAGSYAFAWQILRRSQTKTS